MNKVLRIHSRGDKTPAELLTGVMPATAVARLTRLGVDGETVKADSVPEHVLLEHLEELHEGMAQLWSKAVEGQQKRQRQNVKERAKKRL